MDAAAPPPPFPAGYSKFHSALNAGLLNPLSPPPPPLDKIRSSPTLFEMMANEQDCHPRHQIQNQIQNQNQIQAQIPRHHPPLSAPDRQLLLQDRVASILSSCSPGSLLGDQSNADVKLSLSSRDGLSISMAVHRHVLVAHSRFFAAKLSDLCSKHHQNQIQRHHHVIEISDCDDVEIYVETLRLMYSCDIRRRLIREPVLKVLSILKVSAAIGFDEGVLACLEYLEAAPWAEDEEEKVAALLSELRLDNSSAGEVLKRVSLELVPQEQVLVRLLHVVLDGKDEKARREMKKLVSKMLRENASVLGRDSLYSACDSILLQLRRSFLPAAEDQIARHAGNLHWLLEILIDRQLAEDLLRTWAAEADLAAAHSLVPAVLRHEVSRVTAAFLVGIGKGKILVEKEARLKLLQTWLEPLYEDFGWMRRACKGMDRHLVEEGLANTILTLPLALQQEILLNWFDRFLDRGDDCPNIQRGFEVWWRRAFWKRVGEEEPRQLRIVASGDPS